MKYVSKGPAQKFSKCCCCAESIRIGERVHIVESNGKPIRGQKYCEACSKYIPEVHPELLENHDNEECHLRQMEDFAAYRAAGCVDSYWQDRDNGYAN